MGTQKLINVFEPQLGEEELEAIRDVFESGWIGRGPRTTEFEAAFAEHLDVEPNQLVSTACCTEALFVTMELLGIGRGDEVIIPTVSFVGAGNAVAARGAVPVFCDVDRRTLNPRVEHIEAKLTARTKAILLLHYGGWPGDVEEIARLAKERGVALIEDAACAVASQTPSGSCGVLGDFGAWSFDAMKILVTGDGGMLYVRDPDMASRARSLTYLGLEQTSGFTASSTDHNRWWEFEISSFSRRAIANDMLAGIGLVQLAKLPKNIHLRKRIHDSYDQHLADISWLQLPEPHQEGMHSSYYFYWIQTDESDRDRLAIFLRDRGVYTTFRYYPLHQVKLYGCTEHLPEAEAAAGETLLLPIHQGLSDDDVSRVVNAVHEYRPDGRSSSRVDAGVTTHQH